jgi:homopolymeric O-antigen transport system permease protein
VTVYADLFRYRELFGNLWRRDLRAKYKGSLLGVLWTLAYPLLLMAIYLFVFSLLWHTFSTPHYALFLLSGLAVWTFFATSLQSSTRAMLDNANLIRKVRFPRQLVPLSVVGTQLVTLGVMLVALVVLNLAIIPETRDTFWIALLLAVPLVVFVGGLALMAASLNVVFRDVEFLIQALLLPWFFLTPVLYPLASAPGAATHPRLVDLLHYGNPMTPAVQAIRDPLFAGTAPAAVDVIYLCVAAIVALVLGAWVFTRIDDRIAVEI